ncbi:MAG TPA: hypothetical protein VGV67_09655, partial [Solirubrobacteraceae bacterium]|nr:hypothetical protein [Solirubrobacteraceae bacterium]
MVELKRVVGAVVCGVGLLAPAGAPAARSGGAYASDPATISSVSCIAACASVDAAKAGSVLRVGGSAMGDVAQIVFLGGRGNDDNVVARVLRARRKSVDVVVPPRASGGRLRAINGDGARSPASRAVISVVSGDGGGPLDVRVIGRRVFYDSARQARVDLLAREPMTVTFTVVRVIDGATVIGWPLTL